MIFYNKGMEKTLLKEIISDQRRKALPLDFIERELESSIKESRSECVTIISGVRRCGKSTFLGAIRAKQKESDYFLNFDDERLIDFSVNDFQPLFEVFLELFGEQRIFYFDEIQNVSGWERFVRRLHDDGNKVFITGSNASMLSRELGTRLTGRYVEKRLFPFSFSEFLRFDKTNYNKALQFSTTEKIKIKKTFNRFLRLGGFPLYVKMQDGDYLKSLYESIIYRDIIVRYNIPNEKPLKELTHFCASNIGKEISFNSLKEVIGISSSTSIKEYFGYLENSFLVFLLPRFDYSLKRQTYLGKKIYFIDSALADNVGFRFSEDLGRMLENAVFLQLKRENKEIYFHRKEKECDFLIKNGNKITEAMQVSKSLKNEKTKQREISGLIEAMNEYELKNGTIITEDEEGDEKIDKFHITIKPIYKWLLER